jgi:hypothetical protein|nr:MAG TPA: hypothetical protein [Caudoviricetes sp.]
MNKVDEIYVGILKEVGQFYYVPVLVEKRAKTVKLLNDEGTILGHRGMTFSLNNLSKEANRLGLIGDTVCISLEDNEDAVRMNIFEKLTVRQNNLQDKIKKTWLARGKVSNRRKSQLAQLNKQIDTILSK